MGFGEAGKVGEYGGSMDGSAEGNETFRYGFCQRAAFQNGGGGWCETVFFQNAPEGLQLGLDGRGIEHGVIGVHNAAGGTVGGHIHQGEAGQVGTAGAADHNGIAAQVCGKAQGLPGFRIGGIGQKFPGIFQGQIQTGQGQLLQKGEILRSCAAEDLKGVGDAVQSAVNSGSQGQTVGEAVVK